MAEESRPCFASATAEAVDRTAAIHRRTSAHSDTGRAHAASYGSGTRQWSDWTNHATCSDNASRAINDRFRPFGAYRNRREREYATACQPGEGRRHS